MAHIKVLSWNIFWGLGAPCNRVVHGIYAASHCKTVLDRQVLPDISKAIRDLSPDFAGLQEVDAGSVRNGSFSHVATLSQDTGIPYSYFVAEKDWLSYFNDGNALLSKYPFDRVYHGSLSYLLERRNFIIGMFTVQDKQIAIAVTHLGPYKIARSVRRKQVHELCKALHGLHIPLILLADVNCEPDAEEFKCLLENSGLRALVERPTYPVFNPRCVLDQIFVSEEFSVRRADVLDWKLSDHLPVYAELGI